MTAVPARRQALAGRPAIGLGTGGHPGVDLVDEAAEVGVEAVAGMRQVDPDLGHDAAGIGGEDEEPVAHEDRFLDIVGDHQDGADRHPALAPEIEKIGAQGLGGKHVEGREGLVHQHARGDGRRRARAKPTRWRMPPESSRG